MQFLDLILNQNAEVLVPSLAAGIFLLNQVLKLALNLIRIGAYASLVVVIDAYGGFTHLF